MRYYKFKAVAQHIDSSLPVLTKLPLHEGPDADRNNSNNDWWRSFKPFISVTRRIRDDKEELVDSQFYFCLYCEGWVPGQPLKYYRPYRGDFEIITDEETDRYLHVFCCVRCGKEIA